MRADIDLMDVLPPSRKRVRLSAEEIRKIVGKVQPGYGAPANLQRYPGGWRLRMTFNKPMGGIVRRGITLPDEETAHWVEREIKQNRLRWRGERQE